MNKTICELFAGVGGFRLGFDALDSGWETVWFSQWEPGKKIQWAHDCYVAHFGDSPDKNGELHTGDDIAAKTIPWPIHYHLRRASKGKRVYSGGKSGIQSSPNARHSAFSRTSTAY